MSQYTLTNLDDEGMPLYPSAKIDPVIIAVTGGIGCGKSYISHLLVKHIFNARMSSFDYEWDKELKSNKALLGKIHGLFGDSCFDKGVLNKKILSSLVFSNHDAWEKYVAVVKEDVSSVFDHMMTTANKFCRDGDPFVCEIPMLFEYDLQKHFDITICVACEKEKQIERICKRNNVSVETALNRMSFQSPLSEKIEGSDVVVWNDAEGFDQKKIEKLLGRLKGLSRYKSPMSTTHLI